MGRVISIHQPNLVPHERLLDRLRAADRFVVLAHPQFEKNGYQNRFQHQDGWYTLAVHKGLVPINQKRYVNPLQDWAAIIRRLPAESDLLAQFTPDLHWSLVQTNVAVLRRMCGLLGITTEIVLDAPTTKTKTARLVELCQQHGATTYLSGPSGAHYLDLQLFADAGIAVEIQPPGPTQSGLEVLRAAL